MPNASNEPDALISTGEAARMLGVGRDAVRRYIDAGELQAVKLPSGHYRVRKSSVLRLLERGAQE